MKIIEKFGTLQGEGKYLGVPSYFIRTTGCNLRCEWMNPDGSTTQCDTPYTSFKPEQGYDLNQEKILQELSKTNISHIVITGGEPTMQKDLSEVVNGFMNEDYHVTVETNGTRYVELPEQAFISISPKLESSYNQTNNIMRNIHARNNAFESSISRWITSNEYQLKFVVNEKNDINEIKDIQQRLQIPSDKIYLMPQGINKEQLNERSKWIFGLCIENGYNMSPRMHIDIWGNKRGI